MPKTRTSFTSETARAAGKKSQTPEVKEKRTETKNSQRLIKGEIFDEIRKAFLDPVGKSKTPFYQDFIREFVQLGIAAILRMKSLLPSVFPARLEHITAIFLEM